MHLLYIGDSIKVICVGYIISQFLAERVSVAGKSHLEGLKESVEQT